jgi:hypothetical protein
MILATACAASSSRSPPGVVADAALETLRRASLENDPGASTAAPAALILQGLLTQV